MRYLNALVHSEILENKNDNLDVEATREAYFNKLPKNTFIHYCLNKNGDMVKMTPKVTSPYEKLLKDRYNALNSQYKEATNSKLTKHRIHNEYAMRLKGRLEEVESLMRKLNVAK